MTEYVYIVNKQYRTDALCVCKYFGVYTSRERAVDDIKRDIIYLKRPIELLLQTDNFLTTTRHCDLGYEYYYSIGKTRVNSNDNGNIIPRLKMCRELKTAIDVKTKRNIKSKYNAVLTNKSIGNVTTADHVYIVTETITVPKSHEFIQFRHDAQPRTIYFGVYSSAESALVDVTEYITIVQQLKIDSSTATTIQTSTDTDAYYFTYNIAKTDINTSVNPTFDAYIL
ncbi:MAG: hypothetical protein Faunusvirus24_7 [Faunusvirus sp.]|jgi:hypothetical protein|uniref:Uncharacterized protein n=1 Tax=Faunusvirus sp. TaxID=2487766 RepID=A0A3G4ZZY8_9VIRU|nr:MAG: hypothetical protein Faunusvirus24_7 [Faunusvirus sp.]